MSELASPLAAALADRYRLERELGQGGMATVYLAHDVRHQRNVAIKVLRPELAAVIGAERFVREIRTIAALQHPHILGLIDSGEVQGTAYYVMPFVEGESLRERLVREKQLPVTDAVRIATEVASALDYAHRHGVIHRDIKPENILLHDGQALVADFGIALAVTQAGGTRMTETGMSLGTPHYMSPEQAMGEREITARSDVYGLGCVLYEMLTGEPPFTGPTAQAIVARVLTEEPRPLAPLRKTVPPHIEAAVLTALAKLPADRFESAAAFAQALANPAFASTATTPLRPRAAARRQTGTAVLIGAALLVLGIVASARWLGNARAPAPAQSYQFYLTGDSTHAIRPNLAMSPDGEAVVYEARTPTGARLYLQRLSELEPKVIPGSDDVLEDIFFSPDGNWIGFTTDQAIKKVRLDGTALTTLATFDGQYTGATWGDDNSIVFSKYDQNLYRVSADGGRVEVIPVSDAPKNLNLLAPSFLPGARAVLCTALSGGGDGHVGVISLPTGRMKLLGEGLSPHYLGSRSIAFAGIDGSLMVQGFDPERLDSTGARRRTIDGIAILYGALAVFSSSQTGAIAFAGAASSQSSLMLFERSGKRHSLDQERVWVPRLSADGRRVAYGHTAGREFADIWIYDRRLQSSQRLTTGGEAGVDYNDPVWSPDGKRLALSALQDGNKDLYLVGADGAGPPTLLLRRPGEQWPSDWTPDQKEVLFTDVPPDGKRSIMAMPLAKGGAPHPVVQIPYNATGGRLSPDGRWLAYDSDEAGRTDVYLQSFPGPGGKTRISSDGGCCAVWARNGRELFYLSQNGLVSVQLQTGTEVSIIRRQTLFEAPILRGGVLAQYDVTPDGQDFVAATGQGDRTRIAVVTNLLR
jgi:serine/threonine-protein kinase